MHIPVRYPYFLPVVALALSAMPVAAQSLFGTILGTVTDSSQAVVTGATVRIRSTETNAVRNVRTDPAGDYEVPSLPVGEYDVSCEVAGFKRAVVAGVKLEVDQPRLLHFYVRPFVHSTKGWSIFRVFESKAGSLKIRSCQVA